MEKNTLRIVISQRLGVLLLTFAVGCIVVIGTLWVSDWHPEALIRPGSKYFHGLTYGEEGYDGQFGYAIAMDLEPSTVRNKLDSPAYRYQRILFPILTRILSFGNSNAIPWVLIALPVIGQLGGTYFILLILQHYSINPYYALVYGLGAGFLLAIRLALPEPIAYAFAVGAIYFGMKEAHLWGAVFLLLAFFTKEVTIVYGAAYIVTLLLTRRYSLCVKVIFISFVPYLIFQGWLWRTFGQMGLASGGAMATPFEWIPFMGLFRIGKYSMYYLLMMIIAFSPLVIIPAIYGFVMSLKTIAGRDFHLLNVSLFFNSIVIFFLPFSTYRETGGLLRLSCGLLASIVLFCAKQNSYRILKYLPYWIVYNVFLIK